MATRYYDEAVVNKVKSWVKDPNLTITSPDETRRLYEYIADIENDKPIKLPLIAVRRDPTINILNVSKRPLTFDGATLDANNNRVKSLSAIPISITYQLDIYTRYYEEVDEYVRNFAFNIINYPQIEITIPYNESAERHISNMRLIPEISDNSDIPERLFPGQFSRYTLRFTVDDAYLFSVPVRNALSIEAETTVELRNEVELTTDIQLKQRSREEY